MRLAVNPTRMELLKLKRRIGLARRGHKLLKSKLDELFQRFFPLVQETKQLRDNVELGINTAFGNFILARSSMSRESISEAIMYTQFRVRVQTALDVIMNLRVPNFKLNYEGDILSYGFVDTSSQLDEALYNYLDVLPMMVKLAELEKTLEMIAYEIERTRRRVNALEYILIPNMVETIRYISQKLSEIERGNLTRLMKIKDIVRAH